MIPYRVKYTESEYHIQNSNLLYKTHQHHQNTFEIMEKWKNRKYKSFKCLFCILYKLHNSYFVIFVNFVICIICIFYICWLFGYFGYFGYFNLLFGFNRTALPAGCIFVRCGGCLQFSSRRLCDLNGPTVGALNAESPKRIVAK